MKSGFACICSVVLLAGCGGSSSPTAPTTNITNTSPSAASRVLTGVVGDAAGSGVAGASVAVQEVGFGGDFIVQSAVSTDASGTYLIPKVQGFNRGVGWLLVGASKSGHFSDFKWWLNFPDDADLNFKLDPWVHISPGTSVRGRIGDAFCAGLGYGGFINSTTDSMGRAPCQRFALAIPQSGTLEASISASVYEFDVDIVNPDGTFAAYIGFPYRSGPPLITAPVTAGSVYEIRLAGTRTDFELRTTLR